MSKTPKRKNRVIRIRCDFPALVSGLFQHFSTQLSDGAWENSGGEWGKYEDKYYPSIWNCFKFNTDGRDIFKITLKGEPTWEEAEEDCKEFHLMKDEKIVAYLKDALFLSIENRPDAFDFEYNERELQVIKDCINGWEILPPPLPKLTHKELVKIVGYDFEYVK